MKDKCTTCDDKGEVQVKNEQGVMEKYVCPDCTTLPLSDEKKENIRKKLNGNK